MTSVKRINVIISYDCNRNNYVRVWCVYAFVCLLVCLIVMDEVGQSDLSSQVPAPASIPSASASSSSRKPAAPPLSYPSVHWTPKKRSLLDYNIFNVNL